MVALLSDLSRRAVCGVRTMVKFSVKFSGVKVQHKLSQLAVDAGINMRVQALFRCYSPFFLCGSTDKRILSEAPKIILNAWKPRLCTATLFRQLHPDRQDLKLKPLTVLINFIKTVVRVWVGVVAVELL